MSMRDTKSSIRLLQQGVRDCIGNECVAFEAEGEAEGWGWGPRMVNMARRRQRYRWQIEGIHE